MDDQIVWKAYYADGSTCHFGNKATAIASAMGGKVEEVRIKVDAPTVAGEKRFMAIASKPHAMIAGDMAGEIKAVIYRHAGSIPLALAVGVLRIVERELLDDA